MDKNRKTVFYRFISRSDTLSHFFAELPQVAKSRRPYLHMQYGSQTAHPVGANELITNESVALESSSKECWLANGKEKGEKLNNYFWLPCQC